MDTLLVWWCKTHFYSWAGTYMQRIKSITKHLCISKFMYNIFSFLQGYHKTFKKQKLGKIQLWYLEFVHFAKFSLIDSFTRLLFLVSCSFGLQFFFLSSSGFSWIFLLFLQTKFLHWILLHTGRFPSIFSHMYFQILYQTETLIWRSKPCISSCLKK